MDSVDPAGKHTNLLYAEQVRLLFKNARLAYSTTIVNGAILAFVLREHAPTPLLAGWLGSLLLVTALRAVLVWRYNRSTDKTTHTDVWNRLYVFGTAVAGIVWGSAALLVSSITDYVAHQAFVAFMAAGMSAGGVSVLASRKEAALAFLLPTLTPLAWRYFATGGELQTAMGVLTTIFFAGMCVSAWGFHRAICIALELRFSNRELMSEIDQRRKAEEDLYHEKDRLQTTLRSIGEAVVILDASGRIQYINPVAERLCGWSAQQALHHPISEVFESFDRDYRRTSTAMEDCLRSPRLVRKQILLTCHQHERCLTEEIASALYDRQGKVVGVVGVMHDVTEEFQRTEMLAHAATHDMLTGLPNRNLLKDRTEQAIARAQRKHERFALLFVDLDQFKAVNDTLGHAAGDALLVGAAQRLTACVREEDTIARMGGDEFVVLLDGPTERKQIRAVANKILNAFREPFILNAQPTTTTASIGASLYPDDGEDPETLLDHADATMYRAKEMGRNRVVTSGM